MALALYRHTFFCGDFTLADGAGTAALFRADGVHPIGSDFPGIGAYRNRLLARPTVQRAVDQGRPFQAFFPRRAPERG